MQVLIHLLSTVLLDFLQTPAPVLPTMDIHKKKDRPMAIKAVPTMGVRLPEPKTLEAALSGLGRLWMPKSLFWGIEALRQ